MSKGSTESWGSIPECRSYSVSWWVSAAVTVPGRSQWGPGGRSEKSLVLWVWAASWEGIGCPSGNAQKSAVPLTSFYGCRHYWKRYLVGLDKTKQNKNGRARAPHPLFVDSAAASPSGAQSLMWPPHPTLSLIAYDSMALFGDRHLVGHTRCPRKGHPSSLQSTSDAMFPVIKKVSCDCLITCI